MRSRLQCEAVLRITPASGSNCQMAGQPAGVSAGAVLTGAVLAGAILAAAVLAATVVTDIAAAGGVKTVCINWLACPGWLVIDCAVVDCAVVE